MQVSIILVALAAYASAVELNQQVPIVGSPIVSGAVQTSYTNQPVVVVRKITYYEPELVAVVVEKGVDDIPEETYMIQNYADVLGASNNEIHLCDAHDAKQCMDTPVTKLLVPSLFKSIGQTGFDNFFNEAKEVPWVSTINDNVELVKPVIAPKIAPAPANAAPLHVVSPDVFKYIPDSIVPVSSSVGINEYHSYPVHSAVSDLLKVHVPAQHEIAQTRVISDVYPATSQVFPTTSQVFPTTSQVFPTTSNIFRTSSEVFPANLAAGFAPLDHITSGGSILGAPTVRTAYQPTHYINSHYSH